MNSDDLKKRVLEIISNHKSATEMVIREPDTSLVLEIYENLHTQLSLIAKLLNIHDYILGFVEDCIEESDEILSFYTTCEEENALDYLEMSINTLRLGYSHKWKWLIISLHGALYSMAISCLGSASPELVIRKSKAQSKEQLIKFPEAIELLQQRGPSLPCLELSESEAKSILELSQIYRNEFIHFKPKGWSIPIPDMIFNCINVIRPLVHITFNMGGVLQLRRQIRAYMALSDLAFFLFNEFIMVNSKAAINEIKGQRTEAE